MSSDYNKLPSPRDRLSQYRANGEERERLELSDREKVMQLAEWWETTPPSEPLEGMIHGVHPVKYTYVAENGAYQITRRIEWVNSGIEVVAWTFDAMSPQPVVDVLRHSQAMNRANYENWEALYRVAEGLNTVVLDKVIEIA